MTQFQIPTLPVDVEIVMAGSLEQRGTIFLSENQISYTGTPRLEDFLNQETPFFPFSCEGGGVHLVNKHRLVLVRSSEDDRAFLIDQLMLAPRRVEVHLNHGLVVAGEIYSNLPRESLRVLDFFNQPDAFLPIYQESRKVIVNAREILYVVD